MDTNVILVLTTVGSEEQANQIAGSLVEAGLAACVNTIRGVQSTYFWKGKIEKDMELLLMIKTTAERFEAVRAHIRSIHTYELPEIVALQIGTGDDESLAWIRATTTTPRTP